MNFIYQIDFLFRKIVLIIKNKYKRKVEFFWREVAYFKYFFEGHNKIPYLYDFTKYI